MKVVDHDPLYLYRMQIYTFWGSGQGGGRVGGGLGGGRVGGGLGGGTGWGGSNSVNSNISLSDLVTEGGGL